MKKVLALIIALILLISPAVSVVNAEEGAAYKLTLDLAHVRLINESAEALESGGSYSADIEVDIGYTGLQVQVTMGGKDITESCYKNSSIRIKELSGDVVITAKAPTRSTSDYAWTFMDGELVSAGETENTLTKLSGTTEENVFSDTVYQLETPVLLEHDLSWAIEWRGHGSGGFMLSETLSADDAPYFVREPGNYLTAFGFFNGSDYENYGIAINTTYFDGSREHTYRLENRVSNDGSNLIRLQVDGMELGPLEDHFIGSAPDGETADWLSGRDFVFGFIGSERQPLSGYALEYLKIWELTHQHEYKAEVTAPTCTQRGFTTYTCPCGGAYDYDYVEPIGHIYKEGVCELCGKSKLGSSWLKPEFPEGDYTMVVLPDTQNMVEHWPEHFARQLQWIADNKEPLNIQAVLFMGDMVNTNTEEQWENCKRATDILDESGIAWMPMMGNHDDSAWFNRYYDYETYGAGKSWFGGAYHADRLDHTYWYVTYGLREYLILSLGWAPSWDVLDWAREVVGDNPEKSVIVTAHAYMNKDGTLLTEGDLRSVTSYLPGYPEGEDVWAAFKDFDNVVLAMGGHINSADVVRYSDKNGQGEDVASLLFDRQGSDTVSRLGSLALLTFREDSNIADVSWYSTRYDALYRAENQFSISVPHMCSHSFEAETTEVSCTEPGFTKYSCICGESYMEDIIEAPGHDWIPWTSRTMRLCTRCRTIGEAEVIGITAQPETAYTKPGKKATFTVEAFGEDLRYRWYYQNAGSSEWKACSGDSAVYTLKMTEARRDRKLFCVITDKWGNTVRTETVLNRMKE